MRSEDHPRILVVDDEPLILGFCKAVLSRRGFDTILARDGAEGLDAFLRRHHKIKSGVSGRFHAQNGRHRDGAEDIRTASPYNHHFDDGLQSKAVVPEDVRKVCGALAKPFSQQLLLETIERCLKSEHEKRLEFSR